MEYSAWYGIDLGISYGYGINNADYITREEKIVAKDNAEAMILALKMARDFSENYMSNPDNDLTTVTLKSLKSDGLELVDKEVVVKCTTLEHMILSIAKNICMDE